MRLFTIVLAFVLLSGVAQAFDVTGFTTNMPRATVLTLAERNYKVNVIDENTVVASAGDGVYLSFNFCDGKLVAVQQGLKANLQQVVLVMAEFNAKYGNPFSTNAGTRAHALGQIYEWGTWWNAGGEFASLYYMGSPQGESLSTSYQSKNKCFKVPR